MPLSVRLIGVFLLLGLLYPPLIVAATANEVKAIIDMENPPPGVVFDIDEWDHDALNWALPLLENQVERLRARFPNIAIVIVSHGEEEFALMRDARSSFEDVHMKVRSLVSDGVQFQVCAGHAVMNGQSERGFVSFVKPVSEGVAAIAEYRLKGYIYVRVDPRR